MATGYNYVESYNFNTTPFVDANGNTQFRGVIGAGTQQDPMITGIYVPPAYAQGVLTLIPVSTAITPILQLDVRGIETCYFRILNTGSNALNTFGVHGQVDPTTNLSGNIWEIIASTSAQFTTGTGDATSNSMKVVRRCTNNDPTTLAAGSTCYLFLNVKGLGGMRLVASATAATTLTIEGCHHWSFSKPPNL